MTGMSAHGGHSADTAAGLVFRNMLDGPSSAVGTMSTNPDMQVLADLSQRLKLEGRLRLNPIPLVNQSIPAGYTYLLQLIAHDMVDTAQPLWDLSDPRREGRNLRTNRLMLDTLYGRPAMPLADLLVPDASNALVPTKFAIGPAVQTPPRLGKCPFRDIKRLPNPPSGICRPVLGDIRNDDNGIVSQITVLFLLLHNAIVDLLLHTTPASGNSAAAAARRFACARAATTLIFRTVVRRDVLDRILQPSVRNLYDVAKPTFLDTTFASNPAAALSVEFSHGAFRFGHSMIRHDYKLNSRTNLSQNGKASLTSLLGQTCRGRQMPLSYDWMASWSRFFEMNGGNRPPDFNFSMAIGPALSPELGTDTLFMPKPGTVAEGLPARDLKSAYAAGMWSVDALVAAIDASGPLGRDLISCSQFLRAQSWKPRLQTWLTTGFTVRNSASLVADPPLTFFVLYEAQIETGGASLGTLGSIIVADVIYAVLEQQPYAVTHQSDLVQQLRDVSRRTFDDATCLSEVQTADGLPLTTMPAVLEFVQRQHSLASADPSFV